MVRPVPHPSEGRIAIVTDVGCGMRWTLWAAADERGPRRTAKPCGPDTPTLVSSLAGGNPARRRRLTSPDSGESAEQPLKPLRRESRRCSGSPVVLPPCFLLHGAHGCNRHPAFPAPSLIEGRSLGPTRARSAPREHSSLPSAV